MGRSILRVVSGHDTIGFWEGCTDCLVDFLVLPKIRT